MSRHHANRPAQQHHRRPVLDRLRGLLALLVMVALVVGIPVALYALRGNPLPDTGTNLAALLETLTRPDDDGSLFLAALTWIAWLGWASFTLSMAVEDELEIRLPDSEVLDLTTITDFVDLIVAKTRDRDDARASAD